MAGHQAGGGQAGGLCGESLGGQVSLLAGDFPDAPTSSAPHLLPLLLLLLLLLPLTASTFPTAPTFMAAPTSPVAPTFISYFCSQDRTRPMV